tara:strand:- start:498 stop:935 length:438 start_codon:yes stop_codon:yes gene_type:complete
MNLIQSVKTCFKKYLVIDGRASRSEYWWFFLFASFSPFLLIILVIFLYGDEISGIIVLIFYLPVLVPWATVSIRRLHDLDKSGKIFIIYIVLESIIIIESIYPGLNLNLLIILEFLSWVLTVYFFIIFMFKGSNKKNRYGKPIKL